MAAIPICIILVLSLLFAATAPNVSDPFIIAHKKVTVSRLNSGMERVTVSINVYNVGSMTAYDVSLSDGSWADDVFVVTSGSTSKTWERLDAGANVSHRFILEAQVKGLFHSSHAVIKFRIRTKSALQEAFSTPVGPVQQLDILAVKSPETKFEWTKKLFVGFGLQVLVLSLVSLLLYMLGAMLSRSFLPLRKSINVKPTNYTPSASVSSPPTLLAINVESRHVQAHRQAQTLPVSSEDGLPFSFEYPVQGDLALYQDAVNNMRSLDRNLAKLRTALNYLEYTYCHDPCSPLAPFCNKFYKDGTAKHRFHSLLDQSRDDVMNLVQSLGSVVAVADNEGNLNIDEYRQNLNVKATLSESLTRIREVDKVCRRFKELLVMNAAFEDFFGHLDSLAEMIGSNIILLQQLSFPDHYNEMM